jgi:ComF family protein
MNSVLRRTVDGLLDLIYPPRCLVCGDWEGPSVCDRCVAGFVPIAGPVCAVCGHPDDPEGVPCRTCAAQPEGFAFAAARAAGVYIGPLRHGIHRLKYARVEALAEPLGAWLANRAVADGLLVAAGAAGIDVVVPVPMAAARLRQRGFNQARLLAAPVAELLAAPLLPASAVQRRAISAAQVGLSPAQRRRNVAADTFVVAEPAAVDGQHVLIVDDVFTTGTTVGGLAAALRTAGAVRVDVITLAAGG